MTETDKLAELNWTAFRYIAGELDAAAIEAFESQLDDDQQAREAVAAAVEWAGSIRSAGCAARTRSRLDRGRTQAWARVRRIGAPVSILTAAALALIIFRSWPQTQTGSPERKMQPIPVNAINEEVALAWSALRNDPESEAEAADADLGLAGGGDLLIGEEEMAIEGIEGDDSIGAPPSWLAEAFAIPGSDNPSQPEIQEN